MVIFALSPTAMAEDAVGLTLLARFRNGSGYVPMTNRRGSVGSGARSKMASLGNCRPCRERAGLRGDLYGVGAM